MWKRAGGGILAVVLGLLSWGFVAGAVELGDARICGEVTITVEALVEGEELECYDGSGGRRAVGVVLGVATGVALAAAALAALAFAITGRRAGLLMRLTPAAVALALVTIVVVAI